MRTDPVMLDNDDSTLRYAGCFFNEDLEETVLIAEKVLKKGTLNSKVRIIKIFTQIILRIIKQNDIICA